MPTFPDIEGFELVHIQYAPIAKAPVLPPPTEEDNGDGTKTHTVQIPVGLLKEAKGEFNLVRELPLKDGDTLVMNMDAHAEYLGGRFEIRPAVPVDVILNMNGATLDVRDRAGLPRSGTENQAAIATDAKVRNLTIKNGTVFGEDLKDDRCLSLNGAQNVLLEDMNLYAPRDGVQGSCGSFVARRVNVFESASGEHSGRDHAFYIFANQIVIEDSRIDVKNGHGLKAMCPDCLVTGTEINEGTGNLGGSVNWADGSGTFLIEDSQFSQVPSAGNNAMIILAGTVSRWVGGGTLTMKGTALSDTTGRANLVLNPLTPAVIVVDGGGNTLNGNPFVVS